MPRRKRSSAYRPSYVRPSLPDQIQAEPTTMERVLSGIGYPSKLARMILTGGNPETFAEKFTKHGTGGLAKAGLMAFLGTGLDVATDPLTFLGAGTAARATRIGAAAGKGTIALSRIGQQALVKGAETARQAIPAQMLARAKAARAAGDLRTAVNLERRVAAAGQSGLPEAAQAGDFLARRSIAQRFAAGEKALVDPGGLKFAGMSVVPGERFAQAGRAVKSALSPLAQRILATPAGRGVAQAGAALRNLVDRRATPLRAAIADTEDAARYGAAAGTKRAEAIAREVGRIAKETGEAPEIVRKRLYEALEQPQPKRVAVVEREVLGVDPKRAKAEKLLARVRSAAETIRTGRATATQAARPPAPALTQTVQRANPRIARLERQLDIAEAQLKALPETVRKNAEAEVLAIRRDLRNRLWQAPAQRLGAKGTEGAVARAKALEQVDDALERNTDRFLVKLERVKQRVAKTPRTLPAEIPTKLGILAQREEKVRRALGGRFRPHGLAVQRGDEVIEVSVARLDAALKRDPARYVGHGGAGEIAGRKQAFADFMRTGRPIGMPQMQLDDAGRAVFVDGRHRFATLRDIGVRTVPVTVPKAEAAAFRAKFGAKAAPKELPVHPTLKEYRPRVESVPGAPSRLGALPPKSQALYGAARERFGRMFQEEQRLAKPTPALGSKELEYVPQVLTQKARDAIRRSTPDPIAYERKIRALSEAHPSQKPREFVENRVIDARRYQEAHGTRPPGSLSYSEVKALEKEGIVHRRYLTVEEINRKAAAGELTTLGAQWKGGKLVRAGEKVEELFSSDPALALGVREHRHARAMAAHRFFETLKRRPDIGGARRIGPGGIVPAGHARVSAPALEGWTFPTESARLIDDTVKRFTVPEEVAGMVRAYDAVLGKWKQFQLATPGYTLRNAASDVVGMNVAGMRWRDMPGRMGEGLRIARGERGILTTATGRTFSYDTLRDLAQRNGVTGSFYSGEIERTLEQTLRGPKWVDVPGRGKVMSFVRTANEFLEDQRRYALFAERIAAGELPEQAAKTVKRFLFDYGDITVAEREIGKRLMPFYTWTRKALPLYAEEFLRQPGKFTTIMHAAKGVETALGGEEPDPRFLQTWMRDTLNVRVRQTGPGKYEYFLLGNWLPYNALLEATQPVKTALGMLTPAIKVPVETYTGERLGREGKIETFEGQPGSFAGVPIPGWAGGVRAQELIRSIAVLNLVDKLVPGQAHRVERSMFQRILGAGLGAASQPQDVRKGRDWYLYRLTKEIGQRKAAYDKAMAGGHAAEASQIEPGLLRVFREREQIGRPTGGARPKDRPSEALLRASGLMRR